MIQDAVNGTAKLVGDADLKKLSLVTVFFIFMTLIGLWNGSTAAKKPAVGEDIAVNALLSGLLAGLSSHLNIVGSALGEVTW